MSSCNYCKHQRWGEWSTYCKKDVKTEVSPEGVTEKWHPRNSQESLELFRKKYGGRCPYYSSMPMFVWRWLLVIGVLVILVGVLKRLL